MVTTFDPSLRRRIAAPILVQSGTSHSEIIAEISPGRVGERGCAVHRQEGVQIAKDAVRVCWYVEVLRIVKQPHHTREYGIGVPAGF
jgi:hypothetical protein